MKTLYSFFLGLLLLPLGANELQAQYQGLPYQHELRFAYPVTRFSLGSIGPEQGLLPEFQYRFYGERWGVRMRSSLQPFIRYQTWSSLGELHALSRAVAIRMGGQYAFWKESFFRWVVPYGLVDFGGTVMQSTFSPVPIRSADWSRQINRERYLSLHAGVGANVRFSRVILSAEVTVNHGWRWATFLDQQIQANPPANIPPITPPPADILEGLRRGRRWGLYNVTVGFLL